MTERKVDGEMIMKRVIGRVREADEAIAPPLLQMVSEITGTGRFDQSGAPPSSLSLRC